MFPSIFRFYYHLVSLFFFLPFISTLCHAGEITGIVRNSQSKKPLSGVMVEIEENGITLFTDSSGTFSIDTIKPGSYNLLFYHDKSEPLTINDIFISGDGVKRMDVELNPLIQSLEKMVVKGYSFRRPPDMSSSTKTMSFDEILRSPGALVDVQRAVQNLPSVSSGADNTNEIIVRGGNPGENLLIMDNIEIPNANHFGDQGSGGGVISLINPLLVKNLTFSAGAPPAQYGSKASSVLDISLREGNDVMVIGGVDLGMAGVGFHAEGPLWNGATFMASANKSFLDLFAHFASTTAIPKYWGLQSKLSQKIGDHKVYANFIYGDNGIEIRDANDDVGTDGDKIEAGGMIYASGVSWDGYWGDRFSTIVTLSGVGNSFERLEYSDSTATNTNVRDSFFVNKSVEQEQTLKMQGSLHLENNTKIIAGVSAKRCDFDIDIWERPDTVWQDDSIIAIYSKDAISNETAFKYGAFLSSIINPVENLKLVPGIRFDAFTYNNSKSFSPRLGTVYSLTPRLDLTAALGLQFQDPDYSDLVAAPQNRNLKPKRAATGIIGTEYLFQKFSTKIIVEGFYKQYDNMPVDSSLLTTKNSLDKSDVLLSIGEGRSYGLEIFLQKKLTKNVFWTFAYSLSRSQSKDLRPGFEGQWVRGDYDFQNALTVTGGYKLEMINQEWFKKIHDSWWVMALSPILPFADRIELSAKWRYLGGRPWTSPQWSESYHRWVFDQQNYNASQYPDYHRLDLRYERRFGFGFLQMIYYFDLQNIYNKKNIWTYMYSNRQGTKTPVYQFQFFPAGGVIIGF